MDRLDAYFKEYNKIDEQTEHTIFEMNPYELINLRRIDIIVKYFYIKARETDENLDFARELYGKHIEALGNRISDEQDNKEENTIERYLERFDEMIDRFKETGFNAERSVIPIGRNNEVLDGTHQTACALYFNSKIKVMQFPDLAADYGFDFFRRRQLDDLYLDFIIKEYVQLKKEVHVLIVWPIVGNKINRQFIEGEMNRQGKKIVYHKQYQMTREVLEDFVFTVYRREHWIGFNLENFSGVKEKADFGYDENGHLILYVLEGISVEQLDALKKTLRAHFKIGKPSIHTADTHAESVEIASFLLEQDYEQLLRQHYIDRKDIDHTFIRFVQGKLRYYYRQLIYRTKNFMEKPT